MALMVQIHQADQLDESVWKAHLSPSEIRFLDHKAESTGPFSILLLTENPAFDRESRSLSFNPSRVKLLNAGTSDTAILIGGAVTAPLTADPSKAPLVPVASGDQKFLQSLPPHLKDLGTQLLREVRGHFPGDLVFYPDSGRYVQTPDNFWTIKTQPRDRSFRITVRGKPKLFDHERSFELKPDRIGYSSFKVDQPSQIEALIRVLKQVRLK